MISVRFCKSYGTTQPLLAGHSLLLLQQAFRTSYPTLSLVAVSQCLCQQSEDAVDKLSHAAFDF